MRSISKILFICLLITGCRTNPVPVPAPTAASRLSDSKIPEILESSAQLNVFNVVRTNAAERVAFTNVIQVLDKHINTKNCDTTTLKNEFKHIDAIVVSNLTPSLDLLGYYSQNSSNCTAGLEAIKTGIQKGLR